ncbi:hypothetical protein [Halobaculum magnesiiphilum]|uniref:Rhomboid family protein n=1 Tax=Halobaculum magnesiiphilum TaxID=1017351 RepID=A0A8T8WD42_9EURY|nr:hypothetical protein [Halobaculum magnesiiphilum]QZP37769.1 hypothetical protein K6T50_00885 [Halobaculum magnesiiphilum]
MRSRKIELFENIALLIAVPALLALIHFTTPSPLQQQLVFDHASLDLITFLTASYVHASNAHLYGNIVGYLLGALYAFALALFVGRLTWFRRAFAANLLFVPILVHAADYVIWSTQYPEAEIVSRGFSGVAAAFTGTLLVALYVYVDERHGSSAAYAVAVSLFLLLMQLIDLRYAGGFRLEVAGVVAAGITLVGGSVVWERLGDLEVGREELVSGGLVVLVAVVLGYIVFMLFPTPSSIVNGSGITNVYAHASGLLAGLTISLFLIQLKKLQ